MTGAITKIHLSVNGHMVPFTFVGHPTKDYMERARREAEKAEREMVEKHKNPTKQRYSYYAK